MLDLSQHTRLIVLGVTVPTFFGLLYWLLKSSDDDEDECSDRGRRTVATSRQTVIDMTIPRKDVGLVIGRQGSRIKELQETSGARINFKDDSGDDKTDRALVIRGTPEAAQAAQCLILKLLADQPEVIHHVMEVPTYALGRIIGKGGESVRQMSRASDTKIFIDRSRDIRDKPKKITISGTKDNIVIAKSMIQEKLDEEEACRAKAAVAAANRDQRRPNTQHTTSHAQHVSGVFTNEWEMETAASGNMSQCTFPKERGYVEVYVSAIANPDVFWVQLIGSMALQLDKLSEDMTTYYNSVGGSMTLSSVEKGSIVAAPFENDNTWYRARVMDVQGDKLDVFYVDYGDSAYLDLSQVRQLCTEYFSLPSQAIECKLHGVKPVNEDGWSENCFDRFEELTQCAKWKVVVAELKAMDADKPALSLVDTNGPADVNIGEELIREELVLPADTRGER